MSLFIGNISKTANVNDLARYFEDLGKCHFKFKGSYAFAEYDNEKDAEYALDKLQAKNIGGRRINIEWSKKSRFYNNSNPKKKRSNSPRKRDHKCYICGSKSHSSRECRYLV